MKSKEVSLVLSCGGARGVAHIGVIEGLLEAGYTIKSISGSSMGAVVGGVYAAGKLDLFKDWMCNMDRVMVFKLVDFTFSTQGFIRGERVFNEMKKFVAEQNIEDLDIPFAAVATDITNKKEKVFTSGSLYSAIRASAAIPSVLTPSVIDGAEMVDGGVINPLPIDHLPLKSEMLVVSDVNAAIPADSNMTQSEPPESMNPITRTWNSFFKKDHKNLGFFEITTRSIDLMQDQITTDIIQKHKPQIIVEISRDCAGTFEFYHSKELIEAGRRAIHKALKK